MCVEGVVTGFWRNCLVWCIRRGWSIPFQIHRGSSQLPAQRGAIAEADQGSRCGIWVFLGDFCMFSEAWEMARTNPARSCQSCLSRCSAEVLQRWLKLKPPWGGVARPRWAGGGCRRDSFVMIFARHAGWSPSDCPWFPDVLRSLENTSVCLLHA